MPAQRVCTRGVIADPVGVAPPQGRKARVEAVGRRADRRDPDGRGKQPAEPARSGRLGGSPLLSRDVCVRDLAACVDSGVRAPGDSQGRGLSEPQNAPQRLLDRLLDGCLPRLRGPAVER